MQPRKDLSRWIARVDHHQGSCSAVCVMNLLQTLTQLVRSYTPIGILNTQHANEHKAPTQQAKRLNNLPASEISQSSQQWLHCQESKLYLAVQLCSERDNCTPRIGWLFLLGPSRTL
eukprot:1032574-Amphidinium_carterae.1